MRRPERFYGLCETCDFQKTPGFCAQADTESKKNWYECVPGIFDRDKCLKCNRYHNSEEDRYRVYNP